MVFYFLSVYVDICLFEKINYDNIVYTLRGLYEKGLENNH